LFRPVIAATDLVSKVRGLSVKVEKWAEKTRGLLESGKKLPFQDARALLETGEKLKVNTQELRTLRSEMRAARNWSNKAKKHNLEDGSMHVNSVQELIDEHESLLIEMPEELNELKQAIVGYCICRRPYDGFMIGCDHCEVSYKRKVFGVSLTSWPCLTVN
jgi:hypothetical protein